MTKHSVTDENMAAAGLSEEEMAALEEGETELPSDDKVAAETDGDDAVADSDSEVPPQAPDEEAGVVADPVEDEVAAVAAEEDAVEEEYAPPPPSTDSFRAQLAARGIPENYEDQLHETNEAIEALDAQLAESEIDYATHAKQNRTLTSTLSELAAMKREAEFVVGNNEVMADQHWNWEVDRFVDENDQFKNPVVYGALRGALEELYADEANTGNPYRWFLREAATSVRDAFNLDTPAIPASEGTKGDEVRRAEQIQADRKGNPQDPPPKTLGAIPAAAETEESTDEFAQIDKLEGMDLEAALAKMPKSKSDQYLDSRNY